MHKIVLPSLWRTLTLFSWLFAITAVMTFMTGCESSRTIVHDLDEKEANEILNLLASRSISAVKSKAAETSGGGSKITLWNIDVPELDATKAMSILNQNGLPRKRGQNLLNIFSGTSLVPSEMSEKIRYQAGLNETLSSIIRKMDGVLDAEVQISFPEEDPLNPGQTKGKLTASVYVKYSPLLDDPNVHLSTKIKSLVASGVPNLEYDNVSVILDRARFGNIESLTPIREEKSFVNIWSIVVAQESVTRFRLVFFSFILLVVLAILTVGWLLWKLVPVIERLGGYKAIFSLSPFAIQKEPEEEKEKEEGAEEAEEGASAEPSDKEIDET